MIERRLDGAGTIDRSHNEIAQAADRASAICAAEFNALIHIRLGVSSVVRPQRRCRGRSLPCAALRRLP
jgi:hypothetical protein